MPFPNEFAWGTATAAYQIEGAFDTDGRGLSVWDMLCRKPGAVFSGHTGDVACDHYHHFRDDVRLMQQMGLRAYRLSVSWSRVLPQGVGAVNEKGLAFYDALIDALLEANITPYVTLFHWDYPYELYCRGGWLHPDSPDWFADYTQVMVDRLSDRVRHWFTQNEPQCFIGLGHYDGIHAPGVRLGWEDILRMTHNSLLAHGKSVQVIRSRAKTPPLVGAAPVGITFTPWTDSPADIDAARQQMFSLTKPDPWNNSWYADPMIFGHYPEDGLRVFESYMPAIGANDMQTIQQPLDFYGCNIYHAEYVRAGQDGRPEIVDTYAGHPGTLMNWWVRPEALYWGPRLLNERYGLPVIITENGLSNPDWVSVDGKVHDPQRIDFTTRYLVALRTAIEDGVPVQGYFHWSLMDNFEWAEGYKQRFGMIHVDFRTQVRTLKDSAYWYRDLIACNGANLPQGRRATPDINYG
ncbi:MAG: GH1 family beta-glucosidase [Chloroflexota bacterium]|nr:GH1 family beta-glucosidase [Chloroflexota bacterium]